MNWIIAVFTIIAYLAWIGFYLAVVDNVLRKIAGGIFGVSLEREWTVSSVDPNVVDLLLLFGWKSVETLTKGKKLLVNLIQVNCWLAAIIVPMGVVLFWLFRWIG